MRTLAIHIPLLCLVLAGCTVGPADTSGDPDATTTASTGEAPTTGDVPDESSGEAGSSGAALPDMAVGDGECDPWLQDCPSGYKCMAWALETEGSFTGNKCTPVVENPKAAGDDCKVEGGWWSGIDDCDHGLACWDINHDTNTGNCVPLCTNNADAPECPENTQVCSFWVPGIAHVCLTTCDPLIQDCNPGQACLPEWGSNAQEWVCTAEYSFDEGQEFDPCAFSNVCDPGLMCWDPAKAVECSDPMNGCCLALCELDNPLCNGDGAVCTPFYSEIDGTAPPEFENVGLCVLPG